MSAPGVWYSFFTEAIPESQGFFTLSVFLTNFTFPHQITVLTGESCDALTCIAWDASTTTPAYLEWTPLAGQMYYIAVQGYGEERGDFELGLSPIENVA